MPTQKLIQQQVAGRCIGLRSAKDNAASKPVSGCGGNGLPAMIALRRARCHQMIGSLGKGIGHQELQLSRLVASGRQAGLIVSLDPYFRTTQMIAQAVQWLNRRRQESERHSLREFRFHSHSRGGARFSRSTGQQVL